MSADARQPGGARVIVSLAALVIVVAGMRAAESILIPFLLSIFIGFISTPPLFWLKRQGIPTPLSLLIVIGAVISIMMGIVALIGSSLDDITRSLPFYQARLEEAMSSFFAWLKGLGIKIPEKQLRSQFNPASVMNLVTGLLTGLGALLKNVFLILLTVTFILLEASSFPHKLRAAFGSNASFSHFSPFRDKINRYLVIKTSISLITGVVITIWLLILGVDYPFLLGFLAFLLNYIPTIGSIIAAVPAVLLAMIQLGTGAALLTGLGYFVTNIAFGTIIEPRFMGRGLGLSALIVFLSLVFWGWVLGPVGMLLSVLLTMTLKIALDSYEDTRWIGVLLGPEEPPEDIPLPSGNP